MNDCSTSIVWAQHLVCMKGAKYFIQQFTPIYVKPDFLAVTLLGEIPKATEANQPAVARRRNDFVLADPRAAALQEPPTWRLQSPKSRVSIPNIPSGQEEEDEEEKQRRRGSAERPGSQSCSTGRRQNVRRPTGPGATFTTCEGGAVEPFIPNHRTNLLGWYRAGVEVWVGGGGSFSFFNRSPSLFPSFEHCQRWRSAARTENIQSR